MEHIPGPTHETFRLLILATAFAAGCADLGEANEVDGASSADEFGHLEPADLAGMTAVLFRQSSICVARSRIGLSAVVGTDIEFTTEDVAELDVPCPGAPSPAHEVYFVDNSLVFEFRDLAAPVTFPESDMEGYEIYFDRECGDPVVVDMNVDDAVSNVGLASHQMEAHLDRLFIDFSGLTVQPDSFLKVDLRVVSIDCGAAL